MKTKNLVKAYVREFERYNKNMAALEREVEKEDSKFLKSRVTSYLKTGYFTKYELEKWYKIRKKANDNNER